MTAVGDLFGPGGALAERIPGYSPRTQQVEMARAVEDTLAARDVLVCEAGTGTGKTLAYLVPALASGLKVIVSTGTRHLQDQLFRRELPRARAVVGRPVSCALLKGRANYLCVFRLERALSGGIPSDVSGAELTAISGWAGRTEQGDIAELATVPEGARAWREATSTVDNCLGQDCPRIADCHVLAARRRALESEVVVVNHHLFLADLALKEDGFGELLPSAEAVVLDEAHQLPDTATQFFGTRLSAAQATELAGDAVSAYRVRLGDDPELPVVARVFERMVADFRLAIGRAGTRVEWAEVVERGGAATRVLADMATALGDLQARLERHEGRDPAIDACARRARSYAERLDRLASVSAGNSVSWIETTARGFVWHSSPLDIDELFASRVRSSGRAWVLTSATLAVRGDLSHFARRLGLDEARSEVWESPFDYANQSLMYLPPRMPDPRSPAYGDAFVELCVEVLEASGGRAFVLFTSHAALARAAEALERRLRVRVLVQGRAPRSALLERFEREQPAVLLGTSSFWEGVDVRGQALSCVIIDKLPFGSPADPVSQARIRALREQGEEPFMKLQVPEAVIALKQGVGRLIRDETDSGVVVLADPRVTGRSYGRVFLDSLPPMPRTRDREDVSRFFARETSA